MLNSKNGKSTNICHLRTIKVFGGGTDAMTTSKRPLPRGFRTALPGLLSPARLLEAVRTFTRFAVAASARSGPILDANFRARADQLCARARKEMPG
ncbi:MAG: hypothetical protein ACRYF2_04970 [Janthinobacterium lividum]